MSSAAPLRFDPSDRTDHHRAAPAQGEVGRGVRAFDTVRAQTMQLVAPLAPEDMVIQSMPEASPVKWHLAHTTWFFERFILATYRPGYQPYNPAFDYLFNSYYNTVGPQHCRPMRGMLSRPTIAEVYAYRRHVDDAVRSLLADHEHSKELAGVLQIGLNHEQQHQELILTDVKHMLSANPLLPAVYAAPTNPPVRQPLGDTQWSDLGGEIVHVGADASASGAFRFDNESPRHRVFLEPYQISHRPVSNGEYLRFVTDGGYSRHELWLSMGWSAVQAGGWKQPLYWFEQDGRWRQYTLSGVADLRPDEPVCHLSYFEADAYARWADARLPTEFEWEHAAAGRAVDGAVAEDHRYHPKPLGDPDPGPRRFFGDVWEWTQSSYAPYPGYRPPHGALGEYNGKFMCNQYVLRGGSCATPKSQARLTYRNFFPPESRWQFAGLRLARSVSA